MFTEKLMKEMEAPFRELLRRMAEGSGSAADEELAAKAVRIARAADETARTEPGSFAQAESLKCLYASMPLSDAADYPLELFEAFARHGVFLWEKGPFAGKVPEKLFAGYVLHHRVNNEDLTEHREFFYGELKDRIAGMSMEEAVREVNYWCASQATYRSTDGRTASPMCVYRSAYGRCGEESTFTVSALRSVGIPARQVYVPLWSHCDDNHAWVEAWCDGKWIFLGACEPEEVLGRGWFTGASSRAMLVHSRLLLPAEPEKGDVGEPDNPAPQISEGSNKARVLNQLGRYALTTVQEVEVRDPSGEAAPEAEVSFEVMNSAHYGEIASARTDRDGRCSLLTGIGTLHVTAAKDGAYGEALVNTGDGKCCSITLKTGTDMAEGWRDMLISAPKDSPKNRTVLTQEQKTRGRERLQAVTVLRREKEERFYDEESAKKAISSLTEEEKAECVEIMKKACGNQGEIAEFLSRPADGYPLRWKRLLLKSLRDKDYRDITADILEDACTGTASFEGSFEDEILIPYILCPRVGNEMIRPFKGFILSWLKKESDACGRDLTEEIRREPAAALRLVREKIRSDETIEYGNLITSAEGALRSGWGSVLTGKTVCVQILRTLGIPARLNPVEGMPEVWVCDAEGKGRFVPLERRERTCEAVISGQSDVEWNYFGNWTMARFDGTGYRTLMLGWGEQGKIKGAVPVFPGRYRVLTANRLPNGNILAKELFFELKEGERKEICLELAEAKLSDMPVENDIADFALRREDGTECRISELTKEREGLFIWLGEDEEPTEHILNEIFERREEYAALRTGIYFVAAHFGIRKNPVVEKVLKALPDIELMSDDFGADMEAVARRMYLEPGRLPLAVIINPSMMCVYGVAGYNVGTGDMILKLLRLMGRKDG